MLTLRVGAQVAEWLSDNIWLWLLIHDEALSLLQSIERFLLDAVNKIMTCGNVMDQANDLAGGPDLQCC